MFGASTCGKCGGKSFKLQRVEPSGSRVAMNFIQCSGCGTPVGVAEYYDAGSLLKEQETVLKEHGSELDDINARVRHVEHLVVQIANYLNRRGSL